MQERQTGSPNLFTGSMGSLIILGACPVGTTSHIHATTKMVAATGTR